jgi:hypothetical protein
MKRATLLIAACDLVVILSTLAPAEEPVPEILSNSDWTFFQEAYETGRHEIRMREDGRFVARNPRQQWCAEFDGRGFLVRPDHGEWTWGMELAAVDAVSGMGVPEITTESSRLNYRWNENIEEWFVNDRRGLEQGWTIQARSPGRPSTSETLTLRLTVRGSLRPCISDDHRGVAFEGRDGKTALTYGELKAWDATNKALEVRFAPGRDETSIAILLDDAGATYPITIDPIAQQEASLTASNPGWDDFFGITVAVSGDTVVVGAPTEDSPATGINGTQGDAPDPSPAEPANNFNSGAAYVFVRSGSTWSQQAYLKASDAKVGDVFGFSVGISGDTVVVGAQSAGGVPHSGPGAAYVFVRSGTTWSQQAILTASNPKSSSRFGRSIAISGDSVVVGAYREDSAATGVNGDGSNTASTNSGAAYVFVRNGTTWSEQAYLKASNTGSFDGFGEAVAISGDTVVVGAALEDSEATGVNGQQNDGPDPTPMSIENTFDSGAAYVFVRSVMLWSQQAYLKASNTGEGDGFGKSVAVSGDTVVVGGWKEGSASTGVNGDGSNDNAGRSGAAYVFVRNGAVWSQEAYLKASNTGGGDQFGRSVAVLGDRVLVGAAWESSAATGVDGNGNDDSAQWAGAAYLFGRTGVVWSQTAYLKASNTMPGDIFGYAVALAGTRIIVGAPDHAFRAAAAIIDDAGAVYVFNLTEPEIGVEQPAGISLENGLSIVDFGTLVEGENRSLEFVVKNSGGMGLTGIVPALSGSHAGDFSLSIPPAMTVPGGGMTKFAVTFTSSDPGNRTASLSIASNDANENPFTITLIGFVLSCTADSDGDGMNDGAEYLLRDLGFDWKEPQSGLVDTYYASANKAGLFTVSQVHALHAPAPLISQDPASGKFRLTMDWKRSTDLLEFFDFPANEGSVFVNEQGDIVFEFTSPDEAAFFRVEVE